MRYTNNSYVCMYVCIMIYFHQNLFRLYNFAHRSTSGSDLQMLMAGCYVLNTQL